MPAQAKARYQAVFRRRCLFPRDGLNSRVTLRDAALVGGYLDGEDRVAPAFERTAGAVIEADRPR